jgi:hypothetical protein
MLTLNDGRLALEVDLRLRHENYGAEFAGTPYRVVLIDDERDAADLEAVRQFIEEHGQVPTQASWMDARMMQSRPFRVESARTT